MCRNYILSLALFTLLTIGVSAAAAQIDFFAPKAFDGGVGFAASDMTGDGKVDMVSVRPDRVSLSVGDGTGNFAAQSTVYQCPGFSSTAIRQPLVADFTGDGKSDIAVWIDDSGCRFERSVMVLPGNGAGGFGTPIFTTLSNFVFTPNQFETADVNGDGRPDIVVALSFSSSFDRYAVMISNNDGTFTAPVEVNFGFSQSGSKMQIGDVNGDGKPDILVGNRSPESIMVLLGNGNGTFAAATTAVSGTSNIAALGNFDSTAGLDIFTTQVAGSVSSVRAYLNNGSGSFTAASILQLSLVNSGIGNVTPLDVNGDGKTDVAIQAEARTVIALGNGNGTFSEDAVYPAGGGGTLLKADFNNDGAPDLAVTQTQSSNGSSLGSSDQFAVLLNVAGGTFFTAPAVEIPYGGEDIALADMNGDGLRDIVLTGDANNGEISILLQDSNLTFAKGGGMRASSISKTAGGSSIAPRVLGIADLDNDNKQDVIVAGKKANGGNDNVLFAKNDGAGNLSLFSTLSLTGEVTGVVTGYFNADNIIDVAFSEKLDTVSPLAPVYVAIGNGNGTFQPPVAYLGNASAYGIAIGDFNGDSRPDLAVAMSNGQVAILLNSGSGTFVSGATYDVGPTITDITSADMNGDGKADIVAANNATFISNSSKVNILNGNGDGTFTTFTGYPTVGLYVQKLAVADYDSDGKLDIVTTNNGVISALVNVGASYLRRSMFAPLGGLMDIAVGDLDGDGKPDLVTSSSVNAFGGLSFLQNTSTPTLLRRNTAFDYDGDGKTDASVYRPSNNAWYLLRSTAGFAAYQFGATGDSVVPADYTGDGKTDVAIWRPSNGTWYILRSEDLTVTGGPFGTVGDTAAPGDYDGDGKADLAVYRPGALSTFYVQESTNGFVAFSFGVAEDKPTLGDFDGDGKTDFAVYRPSQGAWYRFNSSNNGFYAVQFGQAGDKVVPADYTGDGKTDVAVWREATGTWYVLKSEDLQTVTGGGFGSPGDIPTPGDFDGDGKTDFAVYRPGAQGVFYTLQTTNGFTVIPWGLAGDIPTPNAYVK